MSNTQFKHAASRRRGVRLGIFVSLAALLVVTFSSVSKSQITRFVHFDWSWKQLLSTKSHPPAHAAFWETQDSWEHALRKRGMFVVKSVDGEMSVEDSEVVESYLLSALQGPESNSANFKPPPFDDRAVALPDFTRLLNHYLEFTEGQAPRLHPDEIRERLEKNLTEEGDIYEDPDADVEGVGVAPRCVDCKWSLVRECFSKVDLF